MTLNILTRSDILEITSLSLSPGGVVLVLLPIVQCGPLAIYIVNSFHDTYPSNRYVFTT